MLGLATAPRSRPGWERLPGGVTRPFLRCGLRLIVYVDSLGDHNPLVKQVRRAVAHGTLTDDGYAVAEGPHLLEEAIKARCEIRAVIVSESARPGMLDQFPRLLEPRQVSEKTFRTLSSTETPQGVIALVKPPAAQLSEMLPSDSHKDVALIAILDGVQDPGNAGAIVRVAEAFGATGAIFLKGTVDPFHPRALRGSAGSAFRLPIVHHMDFAAELDAPGGVSESLRIYAAMPRAAASIELRDADFTQPCAIAIGGEGRGIGEHLAARAIPVHIPTRNVESLNAAVAAGILFYEARRQRGLSPAGREIIEHRPCES
jgi:TrmH family RNA methyltransferase